MGEHSLQHGEDLHDRDQKRREYWFAIPPSRFVFGRTATPTKTSLENLRSCHLYYFTNTPIPSICTMWPDNPSNRTGGSGILLKLPNIKAMGKQRVDGWVGKCKLLTFSV